MKTCVRGLCVVLILLVSLAPPIVAELEQSMPVTFHSGTATASGEAANGNPIRTDPYNSVGFRLTITGTSATVQFEGAMTGSQTNWDPVTCTLSGDATYTGITQASSGGSYTCPVGSFAWFRVRVSECTGCSVSADGRVTTATIARRGGGSTVFPSGTSVPTTCTPGSLSANGIFIDTVTGLFYFCEATDTLTQVNPGEADTLTTVTARGNTSTGNDESNPFEIFGTGGQSTYGTQMYTSSGGDIVTRCISSAGANKCNYYRPVDDTYKAGYKDKDGTIKFEFDGTTGTITKATVDCSLPDVICTVTRTKEFEFVGCQAAVAMHIWNTPASNAPAAACDTVNTNTIKGYASFDATTDETIYASMMLPPGYIAGSLGATFIWKAAAITGAVGLCMQAVRVPGGTLSDQALPAQAAGNCVSDTADGTTLQENHASIAAVTCTNCVANDVILIGFSRDANGGAVTDDMTGDAHVMRALVNWKELQ